ncbi:MAG: dTDP-glucose 4,6-dehydratase [Bacteroidia bacterium]|nr:MAG: dTDP-glucose 4,6-dehydratase [Bacteroidia bacterium]
MQKTILITGGAGFIGSHVVRLFVNKYPEYKIVNLDNLTYAGNLENLKDVACKKNYVFEKADIVSSDSVQHLFQKYAFDAVVHLAAESHVDRSILDPGAFIHTNILGTVNLLNAARHLWDKDLEGKLFYHISTDEVYGSLGDTGLFSENTRYDPHSPYSASKASSDHLVRAYGYTYKLPVILSNCSNNYGPNQFPEKLIPLVINNIKKEEKIPIYGKGDNVRDWLYVEDHAKAIDLIFHQGNHGETYNIGGSNQWRNIDLVRKLCEIMDEKLQRTRGTSEGLITFVKDRAGHDLRYAIDSSKIETELGWKPEVTFEEGLKKTVEWYLHNETWLQNIVSGKYEDYYKEQYANRL